MNKIAIVTGNHVGLGKAFSDHLETLGYKKPAVIRSKDYNVKKPEDCKRLVDEVLAIEGRIDLLINNVGNYITGYLDDYEIDSWQEMMESNLNSAFYMTKYALPF